MLRLDFTGPTDLARIGEEPRAVFNFPADLDLLILDIDWLVEAEDVDDNDKAAVAWVQEEMDAVSSGSSSFFFLFLTSALFGMNEGGSIVSSAIHLLFAMVLFAVDFDFAFVFVVFDDDLAIPVSLPGDIGNVVVTFSGTGSFRFEDDGFHDGDAKGVESDFAILTVRRGDLEGDRSCLRDSRSFQALVLLSLFNFDSEEGEVGSVDALTEIFLVCLRREGNVFAFRLCNFAVFFSLLRSFSSCLWHSNRPSIIDVITRYCLR